MNRFFLVAFFFFFSSTLSAVPFIKLKPNDNGSCASACSDIAHQPVVTGTFVHGGTFHFCTSNHLGQGERGGFQLLPHFPGCHIGINGIYTPGQDVRCLCERPGQVQWIDNQPSDGGSCTNTCRNNGQQAIKTDNNLYACAANDNGNGGFRGGFNRENSGTCGVGLGTSEVHFSDYRCGCK